MDDKIILEFAELKKKKKALEDEAKAIGKLLKPLEQRVLTEFQEAGINAVKLGDAHVYLHEQVWAKVCSGISNERAVQALEEAGLEEHTLVGTSSLSSLMREWGRNGEELPKALRGIIEPVKKYTIKSKKA